VQAAYRTLARTYHPDVNNSPHAARMMRQLNAAYKVLSDPERRSKYDAQRAHQWRARPAPATERAVRPTPTPVSTGASHARIATTARGSAVLPISPIKSSWRIGRLVGLLLLLMVMMGTLMFAFWMIASALEDERFIRASGAIAHLAS
jgi:curved DNA-binding protein CbpA